MVGVVMLESVDPYEIDHGGNMDFNSTRPGSTVHIRAQKPGGLLTLADAHARMSDGELTGTGVEIDTAVKIRVDRSPGFSTSSPVVETTNVAECRRGIPHQPVRAGPGRMPCARRGWIWWASSLTATIRPWNTPISSSAPSATPVPATPPAT